MKSIDLKQLKLSKVIYLALSFLLLSVLFSSDSFQFLVLVFIPVLMFGYGFTYRISKNFFNFKFLTMFGVKLNLFFCLPNYFAICSSSFLSDNEFGPVSVMGSKSVESKFRIRIFNKEGNTTVYTSKNYKDVKSVALKLSNMLEVELVDNILY